MFLPGYDVRHRFGAIRWSRLSWIRRMLFFVAFVGVANLALGYALAVYVNSPSPSRIGTMLRHVMRHVGWAVISGLHRLRRQP